MKVKNTELFVHRGETLTLQFNLTNKDGSPYIVSSELTNPYWLFAISTSKYFENNRYLYKAWCPVDIPRFKLTKALDISTLYIITNSSGNFGGHPSSFNDLTLRDITISGITYENVFAGAYDDNNNVIYYQLGDAICSYQGEYKYITADDEWVSYNNTIITKSISSDITKEWLEQGYYYSIRLVDGELMLNYLRATYLAVIGEEAPVSYTAEQLYNALIEYGHTFYTEFDVHNALGSVSIEYIIVAPARITVDSNILGGL